MPYKPVFQPSVVKRNQDTALIKQVFSQEKGKVGSRGIVGILRAKGHTIGRYRVRAIMREQALVCRIRRRYKNINHALVFTKHDVYPQHTDKLWVTDITYLKTTQGWRYLSVMLDAYSRRVMGYSYDSHMTTALVIQTFNQAIQQSGIHDINRKAYNLVIHSDRGSQYTSYDWHNQLKQRNITGSMSGKGNCYDNAIMERFFGTLKDILVVDESVTDATTMEAKIRQWIVKYNYQRGHSALGGLTPAEFERVSIQCAA